MQSNRRQLEKRMRADEQRKLVATGIVLTNGIKADITRQGLVKTSRMLNDVRPVVGDHEVSVGTTLDDPNYPFFLNNGFVHYAHRQTDEEGNPVENQEPTVGPYHFMENGQAATEGEVKRIWKTPIK